MTQREFIDKASDACLAEQLATIGNEDLREHWRRIIRKYIWAYADQFSSNAPTRSLITRLLELAKRPHYDNDDDRYYACPLSPGGSFNDTETTCNCGADYHNDKVAKLEKELEGLLDPYEVKEPE